MTRDEILIMAAGREIDALIAEKVMGWKPDISEVIAQAWGLVEKLGMIVGVDAN